MGKYKILGEWFIRIKWILKELLALNRHYLLFQLRLPTQSACARNSLPGRQIERLIVHVRVRLQLDLIIYYTTQIHRKMGVIKLSCVLCSI